MWLFSLLFSSNIAFGNISIMIVNVAMSQVFRAMTPIAVILLQQLLVLSTARKQHQVLSKRLLVSVVVLVVGVALAVTTNVDASTSSVIVLGIGVMLSALKNIVSHWYFTSRMHPLEMLRSVAFPSAIILICTSVLTGEMNRMVNDFVYDKPLSQWELLGIAIGLLLSCGCAFMLNILSFLANKSTSPLTMTIGGNIKQMILVLLSIIFENASVGSLNAIGLVVFFIGLLAFSFVKYSESVRNKVEKNAKAM